MVDMARRYVPEMRAKGAQLVIAIPHSGFEKGEVGSFAENAVSRLAEVPGVDAILFGHAHAEFPGKAFASYPKVDIARGTINGVPAVMPGRWGDHLGVIDLTLDNRSGSWKVVGSQAAIRPIFDRTAKRWICHNYINAISRTNIAKRTRQRIIVLDIFRQINAVKNHIGDREQVRQRLQLYTPNVR